ncbi:MAG: restriction endonuclease, partial [Deltaproteobacteria bacterium RIFOXYD12_FULL_50_9]
RLLFLLVIEERHLVFPPQADAAKRDIYYRYYSLQRLRRLSEKRHLADHRRHDLWLALLANFRLFAAEGPGLKLGLAPLAGDLFGPEAIGPFANCTLGNDVILGCLRSLGLYQHPDNGQLIRVNYAALNVEEFGSVYEGLLEYEPAFLPAGSHLDFAFAQGGERAATGSHYTPDDLVQPLIKHSLDYLIAERLKGPDPEKALLALRVADISCGSGHILLAAARRIATELAIVRTGEEQPSPVAFRSAIRDVIRECIYGVDLNPLAVELCKVALWLEAHNPGQPLNFLDHHIKCGNAIVGFAKREEMERGVPDEAFVTMPGDDKPVVAELRKRNKREREQKDLKRLEYISPEIQKQLDAILKRWRELSRLPERNPTEIEAKKRRFQDFTQSQDAWLLNQIAAIPIAQFYLAKTPENLPKVITDEKFRCYLAGERQPQGQATAAAWALGRDRRFFHWFLEFPEIIEQGGFDCILGNPPYLGGQGLSGTYGQAFCEYVKWEYAPAGLSDLVAYFVRRIYGLLRPGGFTAFITTNSIKDGDIRKDGLDQILADDGAINMVVRGIKWPGRAKLVVSLVALHKGKWPGKRVLDGIEVSYINSYFEDGEDGGDPKILLENSNKLFVGSEWAGDGFLLTAEQGMQLLKSDQQNNQVVLPIINGDEINNHPAQLPNRYTIYFSDFTFDKAQAFDGPLRYLEAHVKPLRDNHKELSLRTKWWLYKRPTRDLYIALQTLGRCFVVSRTTKHLCFSGSTTDNVFSKALAIVTTNKWDVFAVLQSGFHDVWARKYSGSLKQDLRYTPSDCFETFPFPKNLWQSTNSTLATLGERYHEHRRALMLSLWLGLTDIYNLFHNRDLSPEWVAKVSKKSPAEAGAGYHGLLELRRLHRDLDHAIRDAYGWTDLNLGHDFVEVETLPENDRVRYTISPAARKEVLKRLLALNHQRAAAEVVTAATTPIKAKRGRKGKGDDSQGSLF